jgi:glycosyltransferase involved in cell wall biosynthesis
MGFASSKMIMIPNGYDPPTEAEVAPKFEKDKREINGIFTISHIGRFHPQKDHKTFLEALSTLTREGWVYRAVLAGSGVDPQNALLSDLATELGIQEHLDFLGELDNPLALFQTVDVNVSSSLGEAFPNVVAESMLVGVPNIVTDVGDSALIVGDSGWVVNKKSPRQLADALIEAMSLEPRTLSRRGLLAQKRIIREFPMHKMIQAFSEVQKG